MSDLCHTFARCPGCGGRFGLCLSLAVKREHLYIEIQVTRQTGAYNAGTLVGGRDPELLYK